MNKLAADIARWRESQPHPNRDDHLMASLMMVVTELAEAAEDVRYGRWDHLPEELADAMIRLLGICGHLGIDIERAVYNKMEKNRA
jgi:NTP pyrophosphatase (non-canonical NTP hydrolase)